MKSNEKTKLKYQYTDPMTGHVTIIEREVWISPFTGFKHYGTPPKIQATKGRPKFKCEIIEDESR